MTDRWAGRTALRGSWLQFAAVEHPVRSLTADTALNHCGQRARSSVRERSREGNRRARGRRECSRAGRAAAAFWAAAGPDWPGTISYREQCLGRDPCRVLGGGRAASVPAGDDQITWPTAMRTAPDLACAVPVGYSVSRRIAPKQ